MSRVGDDNNEARRMREVNEADRTQKRLQEKRHREEGVRRSFNEVMADRTRQKTSQRLEAQNRARVSGEKHASTRLKEQLLKKKMPQKPVHLARHAAMSQALKANLSVRRKGHTEAEQTLGIERNEELSEHRDKELEAMDREIRSADEQELLRMEDRQLDSGDPQGQAHGQGKQPEQDGRSNGDRGEHRPQTQAIKKAKKTKRAHLPEEAIRALVSQIQSAVDPSGRTSMQIQLKGTTFGGVKLKITAEKGKVHCTFENCDKQTKNLLEASEGALMRGLSKRGLSLASLKVL